ncbi:uncharacterized protein METZ01_LOCUS67589 [marine metagenome]|uniref:DUF465 domain-containing protein n=1 Tax=marine metagenome TaxID=408172 RepID=A0A381TF13_9ZZZZ
MQTQQDLPSYDAVDGSDIIHQVSKHWFRILEKHRELDRTIQDSYEHYGNDLKIKELKAQKLRVKDQIERYRSDLENLAKRISKS